MDYKLEESVKMETELIDLRAKRDMMAFQVYNYGITPKKCACNTIA